MVSNKKHWRYNLIWDKVLTSGFLNANKMPLRQHEEVAIFYKNPPTYNPQMTEGKPNHSRGKGGTTKTNTYGSVTIKGADLGNLKHPTSIIRFQKPSSRMAQHPTEKSVEFCEWLIKTYTNKGDTVLDTCAGVGTTVVACVNIERHFIAFENYEKYYYIASRKLNKLRR
jgi:site-specific DNA-methyltransferase (adenine-specific)